MYVFPKIAFQVPTAGFIYRVYHGQFQDDAYLYDLSSYEYLEVKNV